MATTTNYSWETPDDTDLVKDGAAAIRTLGSSIDTTTKALNPSTTLGDIEYRSATANTNTRLGIGSSGQVLSVSGGVPAWATPSANTDGLRFITGASFSAVASVSLPTDTFTSTYDNYKIVFNITAASGAITKTSFRLRAAGADNTTSNYFSGASNVTYTGAAFNSNTNGGTLIDWGGMNTGTGSINSESNQFEITMMSPKLTQHTVFTVFGGTGSWTMRNLTGFFNATTSFDSFTLLGDAGTISGRYRVYGYQNS